MKALSEMKIGMACDHAGFELKQKIQLFLEDSGAKVIDFGTYNEESCDYPDYGHKMAEAVSQGECDFGIGICGTGNGMNMVCNKHHGVRSALCWEKDIAELARKHNNANVLCLPARYLAVPVSLETVHKFLTTEFEGGRHQIRIEKIHLH